VGPPAVAHFADWQRGARESQAGVSRVPGSGTGGGLPDARRIRAVTVSSFVWLRAAPDEAAPSQAANVVWSALRIRGQVKHMNRSGV
jgi:hypothetical protein